MGKEKKIRIPLWIYPSTEEKVQKNYEADNCKSPSEFIEKAILFYCGYLASEEYKQYLPNVVVSTMQGSLDAFEDRMATLLFKIAVELCMMLHVTAATNEIDITKQYPQEKRPYPRAGNASGGQSITEPAEATTAQEINHAAQQVKAPKPVRTG